MTQSQIPYATPIQLGVRPMTALSAGFLTQSFAWMFVGLLLTAGVAWVVQGSPTLVKAAEPTGCLLVIIGQFGLVIGISAGIRKLSATAALGLFFVYAATMGVTLSFIFIVYDLRRRSPRRSSARPGCSAPPRSTARSRSARSPRSAATCSWA